MTILGGEAEFPDLQETLQVDGNRHWAEVIRTFIPSWLLVIPRTIQTWSRAHCGDRASSLRIHTHFLPPDNFFCLAGLITPTHRGGGKCEGRWDPAEEFVFQLQGH